MVRMRSPVQIRLSAPVECILGKDEVTGSNPVISSIKAVWSPDRAAFYFTSAKRLITGFEGDCAERSEVKTVLWTVFKERADETRSCAHTAVSEVKRFGTTRNRLSAPRTIA